MSKDTGCTRQSDDFSTQSSCFRWFIRDKNAGAQNEGTILVVSSKNGGKGQRSGLHATGSKLGTCCDYRHTVHSIMPPTIKTWGYCMCRSICVGTSAAVSKENELLRMRTYSKAVDSVIDISPCPRVYPHPSITPFCPISPDPSTISLYPRICPMTIMNKQWQHLYNA